MEKQHKIVAKNEKHLLFTEPRCVCVSMSVCVCVSGRYLMSQHSVELLFRDDQPFSVCAVHHQDDKLQGGRERSHSAAAFQKTFPAAHGSHSGWAAESDNGCCRMLCVLCFLNARQTRRVAAHQSPLKFGVKSKIPFNPKH